MQLYKITGIDTVADVYGAGTFGGCDYSSTTCTTNGNNGGLVNTGIAVAGFITLACLIALVAIAIRVWRRPTKVAPEVVPIDDPEGGDEAAEQNDKRA